MKNSNWENREKNTRRAALVVSILVHVAIIAFLSVRSNGDEGLFQNVIEAVFQTDGESSPEATADVRS